MPLNLYLDDDSDYNLFISLFTKFGHQVVSPRSVGTSGIDDGEHLLCAARLGCVLLSHNCPDFLQLHQEFHAAGRSHGGIFVIYRSHNPRKDMKPRDILRAIDRIEQSGLQLENGFFKLNEWQ